MFGTKKDVSRPDHGHQSHLLNLAQEYVLNWFNARHDTRLLYHNYPRSVRIVKAVGELAQAQEMGEEVSEQAQLAAWFHLCGYSIDYQNPVKSALPIAQDFLQAQSYPEAKLKQVLKAIHSTRLNGQPESLEGQLLHDAIHASSFTQQFFQERPLLRLEWELMENRRLSAFEWNQLQLHALLNARFYTPYAKVSYEQVVGQNVLMQKAKVEKSKQRKEGGLEEPEGQQRKFQGLERKLPGDATQTFFRANYRNHINLSAIADNKANIMISVNAILVSVIISLLTYKNIPDTKPMVLLPIVIFLVTGLTSLIFAVLSIRPKVTALNAEAKSMEEIKKNIVFFGNFIHLPLEQYEEAMDAVFRDGELLYGNMTRDLYHLGKVLDKKYRYLTMSYNIFMVGFIATVITFLIAVFS